MKLVIMQPYFLPYIGYWQMMAEADQFVVYDNIEFTKKGWIHRNRLLSNGRDELFSLSLKKDSDHKNVIERFLSPHFDREKLLRKIHGAYQKAPYFPQAIPFIEECVRFDADNLFDYIFHSIQVIKRYLHIDTNLIVSSTVSVDHALKGQDKVISLCKALGATEYINPIGGQELYDSPAFEKNGITLKFHKTEGIRYAQFGDDFIPHLSILDVMMFNSDSDIQKLLKSCHFK